METLIKTTILSCLISPLPGGYCSHHRISRRGVYKSTSVTQLSALNCWCRGVCAKIVSTSLLHVELLIFCYYFLYLLFLFCYAYYIIIELYYYYIYFLLILFYLFYYYILLPVFFLFAVSLRVSSSFFLSYLFIEFIHLENNTWIQPYIVEKSGFLVMKWLKFSLPFYLWLLHTMYIYLIWKDLLTTFQQINTRNKV